MKWSKWFCNKISLLNDADREYALHHILEMSSVRERWLQGQLYLESSSAMKLELENSFKGDRTRYDFVCNKETYPMIAELKISSGWHNSKILGLNKKILLNKVKEHEVVTAEEINKVEIKNSFLNDLNRLRNGPPVYEKVLILLVMKGLGSKESDLFKVLHQIELDESIAEQSINKDFGNFYLRIWNIN